MQNVTVPWSNKCDWTTIMQFKRLQYTKHCQAYSNSYSKRRTTVSGEPSKWGNQIRHIETKWNFDVKKKNFFVQTQIMSQREAYVDF